MPLPDPDFARHLLASMRSGLVAVDAEGRIAAWNAEAGRILGRPGEVESALGRPCREWLGHEPALVRLLQDALEGRVPSSRAELSFETGEPGGMRTIGFTVWSVRDGSGRIRGAALAFRDLAPVERSEEQSRLNARLAWLGAQAATLTHELRNPLAGVEMSVGLLRQRLAHQPEERELVETLGAEVRRVGEVVTRCLDFVRPAPLRREPIDPVKLLDEALEQALTRLPFQGELRREVPGPLPTLCGDPEELRGVLANLIVNALQAMAGHPRPEGHRLKLGLHLEAGCGESATPEAAEPLQLVFSVQDTGPGVRAEDRDRIFYPFFSTKPEGSGMGLAAAQKAVVAHGGLIELRGEEGQGACFQVRLPLDFA